MRDTMGTKRSFTVIIVPEHDQPVRRYFVDWRALRLVAAAAVVGVGLILTPIAYYGRLLYLSADTEELRGENTALRSELKDVRLHIESMATNLEHVQWLDENLRTTRTVSDSRRNAPQILPLSGAAPAEFARAGPSSASLANGLEILNAEALREQESLTDVWAHFLDQETLLASTPNVWPLRGWVTSDFGDRTDPFTAEPGVHDGIDIAADFGQKVMAPAGGTVLYAGLEGGYGKVVVVDHGYGVKTRYGHLSQVNVAPGEQVHRGDLIGAVGSSGRSTGPHLHYEVRVNGLAEDPRKFVVEDE